MKNLKVLFFALIVCSCTAPDLNLGLIEPEPPELIKTTIVGNVSDVERNIPHENLEFIVYRSYETPQRGGGLDGILNSLPLRKQMRMEIIL